MMGFALLSNKARHVSPPTEPLVPAQAHHGARLLKHPSFWQRAFGVLLLLVSFANAWAAPSSVEPAMLWWSQAGDDAIHNTPYRTPEEAFAVFKSWIEVHAAPATADNFTPCTTSDYGGSPPTYTNGFPDNYCVTWHYNNGIDQPVRTGAVSNWPHCPTDKYFSGVFTQIDSTHKSMRCLSNATASTDPPSKSCPATPKPVYGETGVKYLAEPDYEDAAGLLGQTRIWRSDLGRFVIGGDQTAIGVNPAVRYSRCYPGYYTYQKPPTNETVYVSYCFTYESAVDASIEIQMANGNWVRHRRVGTSYVPEADINDRIWSSADAQGKPIWILRSENNWIQTYNDNGLPLRKTTAGGKFVDYTYSDTSTPASVAPKPGLLLKTTDYRGQSVKFSYDPFGNVKSFSEPDGRIVSFSYDEVSGNCPARVPNGKCQRLTSVTYPDGKIRRYSYNEPGYLDSTLDPTRAYITGIVDERNTRLSDYRYDVNSRVISSGWGGHNYLLSYNGDQTTITDPTGSARTVGYQDILGRKRLTHQSQPAGSGCAAASSAVTYDANANKTSADDFDGHRSCYVNHSTRNLETRRIEGLGSTTDCSGVTGDNAVIPAGSRKTSTQWHPDWRLPIKVAEPGRIVTSVYNGQLDPFNANTIASCAPNTALLPDGKPIAVLCKQVEQSTTDADGSKGFNAALQSGTTARIWTWTYNAVGQVLSAKDAQNNTTTFVYYTDTAFTGTDPNAVGHTIGDLKSTTVGTQVTQFLEYDKHGNLLKNQDPSGIVTVNTYDPRQRLLSSKTADRLTSYAYDAAGQLTTLTLPSTGWIGFEYDDAHRMKAVKDHIGNRIDYTLDNAGNRKEDKVKDPGGVLRNTLARSIDALSRIQQITGQ